MRTILLVEDNLDDIDLMMMALEKSDLSSEVVVVHDGVEGLEYLNGTGKFAGVDHVLMPKLILLDLKMPRMDGLEFLRRIRADERTMLLPVVVFTTSKEESDKRESYKLGANSYIPKPIDYNTFAETIRQVELYWLGLNEVA